MDDVISARPQLAPQPPPRAGVHGEDCPLIGPTGAVARQAEDADLDVSTPNPTQGTDKLGGVVADTVTPRWVDSDKGHLHAAFCPLASCAIAFSMWATP
jgi:hypothetical protein